MSKLKITSRGKFVATGAVVLALFAAYGQASTLELHANQTPAHVTSKPDWTIAPCSAAKPLPAYTATDRCLTSEGSVIDLDGKIIPTATNVAHMHALDNR